MSLIDWLELTPRDGTASAQRTEAPATAHDGQGYLRAAERLRNEGSLQAALDLYEKAVSFDETLFDAWTGLVDTLVRVDDLKRAGEVAEHASRSYGRTRTLYAAQALVYCHTGDMTNAMRYSDVSVEQGTPSWYSFFVRGEIILAQSRDRRQLKSVRACFQRAIDLAACRWAALLWQGIVYLERDCPALAAASIKEAAHRNLRNPFIWVKLGDACAELDMPDQARFYYEQALDVAPEHPVAAAMLQKLQSSPARMLSSFIDEKILRKHWKDEFGIR